MTLHWGKTSGDTFWNVSVETKNKLFSYSILNFNEKSQKL